MNLIETTKTEHLAYTYVGELLEQGLGYDAIMQQVTAKLMREENLTQNTSAYITRKAIGDITSKGINGFIDISSSLSSSVLVNMNGKEHAITLKELANYINQRNDHNCDCVGC